MTTQNNVFYILLCLGVMFISFGCNNSQVKDTKPHLVIDIDTLSTDGTILFSQVFDDYEIIPLETNEDCIIGSVASIRFCNDYIVILDSRISKSVFVFDHNGKFIRKIGSIGKGPGEYISPHSISINDNTKEILVYDGIYNKVNIYSFSGEFHKSIKLDQQGLGRKSIEVFDDIIYTNSHLEHGVENIVYGVDYNGNIAGARLKNNFKFKDNQSFAAYNHFYKTPDGLRFRSWLLDDVYRISDNFIEPLISLKSEKESIREEVQYANHRPKHLNITNYVEINSFSILEYSIDGYYYTVFCDLNNRNVRSVKFLDFRNDLIQLSGKQMGYFYTSYKDYLVSMVRNEPLFLKEDFVEKVKAGSIKSKNHDLGQVTLESNPVIIMYKFKENPEIW